MLKRAAAFVLVLALAGPSAAAAVCELSCALRAHHHGPPAVSEASCHGHETSTKGVTLTASLYTVCHESGDIPAAVIAASLDAAGLSAIPAQTVLLDPLIASRVELRVSKCDTAFDPRPPYRPLRV